MNGLNIEDINMKLPTLASALVNNFDAWIIGGAAIPDVQEPKDFDIIVPFHLWHKVASLLPKDCVKNNLGGWKCKSDNKDVDVWPGEVGYVMLHPKAQYAWHPRTGIRIKKV